MIGESRRDRLRRILKKLLSDRKEVAVPVAVPVLPTVPGQEVNSEFFYGPIPASFSVYFRLFNMSQFKFKFKLIKA